MSATQAFYTHYVDLLLHRASLSTLFSVFTFSNPGITRNLIDLSKRTPFQPDEMVGFWDVLSRDPRYSDGSYAPECTSLDAYKYPRSVVEEFRLYQETKQFRTRGIPQLVLDHQFADRVALAIQLKARIMKLFALGNADDLSPRDDDSLISTGETRVYAVGVYSLARPAGEKCFDKFDSFLLTSGFQRGMEGLKTAVFQAEEDRRLGDFQVFSVDYVSDRS